MLSKRSIRNAIDTVLALRELGVRVYADGNTVRVAGPPELVTDAVRRTIARKNLDYLAALRGIAAAERERADSEARRMALKAEALRSVVEDIRTSPRARDSFLWMVECFKRQDAARRVKTRP